MGGLIRRIHLSAVKFDLDRKYKYTNGNPFIGKPGGFWYGINDAWLDWCDTEMPDWIRPHVYELDINPSDILTIQTLADFDKFEQKYVYHHDPEVENYPYLIESVDWKEVARHYPGIEINPYFWEKRFNSKGNWYCGWDMASGVIWDVSVIRNISYIAEIKDRKNWRNQFHGLRLLTEGTEE